MYNTIATPAKVLIFGDSITEGMELPELERSNAWVSVVQARSDGKLLMINEGKGGRPTDSVSEFESVLQRHGGVDVVVIALGANDARDISDACVSKALGNIGEMIRLVRESFGGSLPILIVAPTNIRKDALGPTRPIANEREAKVMELGEAFHSLALEEGCRFVSLYGAVPPECLSVDGVHPDSRGHRHIADIMLPTILDVVFPVHPGRGC